MPRFSWDGRFPEPEQPKVYGTDTLPFDTLISDPGDIEDKLTRRIVRHEYVSNIHDPDAKVKITIMHQRRASANSPWQDADSFNLAKLMAGQEIRLPLRSAQTLRLYRTLRRLYGTDDQARQDPPNDVTSGDDRQLVLSDRAIAVIRGLAEQGDEAVWDCIDSMNPGLLEAAADRKRLQARRAAVEEFEREFHFDDWREGEWEAFFRKHKWIFGHNLTYRFLDEIAAQPHYGGVTLSGRGGQRGDSLMASRGIARFTVLLDIKTPGAELITREYRNKVYLIGDDVIGGVAQLQSNCRTWIIDGSLQQENASALQEQGIYTYEPKSILVVGNTGQLDNLHKRATFEMFRRNIHNPEIITFDELLERAKFVASGDSESVGRSA